MDNVINNIYQVFKDYYGEVNVDLQSRLDDALFDIIVYWSDVTVTNEYDESVVIHGLYCKIKLDSSGKLLDYPRFIRDTYSELQWKSGYTHSHIPSLSARDVTTWRTSCLGSGPIVHTIYKLRGNQYYINGVNTDYATRREWENPMTWTLFVFELDKYVQVESVAGGPYFRMSTIGARSATRESVVNVVYTSCKDITNYLSARAWNDFLRYCFENNVLKYAFFNNKYILGMSSYEAILSLSNAFIKWYNNLGEVTKKDYPVEELKKQEVIVKAVGYNREIHSSVNTNTYSLPPLITQIGRDLEFEFKGETVKLKGLGIRQDDIDNTILILNPNIINQIVYRILRILNCSYGKSNQISKTDKIF